MLLTALLVLQEMFDDWTDFKGWREASKCVTYTLCATVEQKRFVQTVSYKIRCTRKFQERNLDPLGNTDWTILYYLHSHLLCTQIQCFYSVFRRNKRPLRLRTLVRCYGVSFSLLYFTGTCQRKKIQKKKKLTYVV